MSKKQKEYPVIEQIPLAISDQSSEVLGYKDNRNGTMIMKGWHNNYSDFEVEGVKGTVTCIGNHYFIEIGKRRFALDLKPAIARCLDIAKADPDAEIKEGTSA